MKILVFTEGTIIMHKNAVGLSREEREQQIRDGEASVHDYATYVPTGNAQQKLLSWQEAGATITYLTSRRKQSEIEDIAHVLERHHFPKGELLHRVGDESYATVAERCLPDVLIEDDCEAIGGLPETTYWNMSPSAKAAVKQILVKESGGIDHLPDNPVDLLRWS